MYPYHRYRRNPTSEDRRQARITRHLLRLIINAILELSEEELANDPLCQQTKMILDDLHDTVDATNYKQTSDLFLMAALPIFRPAPAFWFEMRSMMESMGLLDYGAESLQVDKARRRNPLLRGGKWWPRKPTTFCSDCKYTTHQKNIGEKCHCGGVYQPLVELPDLQKILPLVCACDVCKEYCARPCWPTPDETDAMMDAGYGNKLMGYTYYDPWNPIYMLIPAKAGFEQTDIHDADSRYLEKKASCTFLTEEGLCAIHGTHKPIGGRMTHHTRPYPGLDFSIVMTWDTPRGKQVRDRWENEFQRYHRVCSNCEDSFSIIGFDDEEEFCEGCR